MCGIQSHSNAKRALVLVTDAYGGFGGISKFNRDFLSSCTADEQYQEVVALPRIIGGPILEKPETLPQKLRYESAAANGKSRYAWRLLSTLIANRRFDVVICGHINLLSLAWLASRVSSAPLVLITHGIEAWQPTSRWMNNWLTRKVNYLVSVSETTRQRFQAWAPIKPKATFILPNCINMTRFQPLPKNQDLVNRYKLQGKTVLMTLARLPSRERYKGVDEVLEVLRALAQSIPRLIYLVVGDGNDLSRLQEKARALGVADRVIFPGKISESEKVDYYNLADAFVMPGRGEGFGIVYLEAMACGVPVVASLHDGSKEAVRGGLLGVLVNPDNPTSVENGIRQALTRKRGIPAGLDYFSDVHFRERVHIILSKISGHKMDRQIEP